MSLSGINRLSESGKAQHKQYGQPEKAHLSNSWKGSVEVKDIYTHEDAFCNGCQINTSHIHESSKSTCRIDRYTFKCEK